MDANLLLVNKQLTENNKFGNDELHPFELNATFDEDTTNDEGTGD